MDEVGPMKLFRTKSAMWQILAEKMANVFELKRTGDELSKRLEAVINEKKSAVGRNRVSGAKRVCVEYEEELAKITAKDDSIEPEVMRGVKYVQYKGSSIKKEASNKEPANKKPRWDKPNKKLILNSLSETLKGMEKRKAEREVAREDRKNETYQALIELIRSIKKPDNSEN